ncbi:MAG: LysR substrate-binding domain-containing protein [Methylovirgula sp.]|nr:LysR substrate-binding domain-containing protein [Methylovirgula sp.]
MTLEQLRIFVAVAERQHVTRAAEALNLTQSAASAAIAALEARHGSKLFNRVGRGIELTEAGRVFLDEARAVLARADMAEQKLAELAGLKRGRLLIQASQTIASYWLPRRLVDFRRAYPGIEIKLSVGNTADAAKAVNTGMAELGFIEGPIESSQLKITEVARDQLIVVVAADHPWATRRKLNAEDLVQGEWVLREPGSGTRSVFEDALAQLGVPASALNIVLELPTNEAVRAAVEAGMGATALSASAAVSSLEAGLLSKVALKLPARAFNLIQQIEREPSHAARALVAAVTGKPRNPKSK